MEADKLKELLYRRTGLRPNELVCPREKTGMTPCISRDGDLACADDGTCVGCGHMVKELLEKEIFIGQTKKCKNYNNGSCIYMCLTRCIKDDPELELPQF